MLVANAKILCTNLISLNHDATDAAAIYFNVSNKTLEFIFISFRLSNRYTIRAFETNKIYTILYYTIYYHKKDHSLGHKLLI